MTVLRLSDDRDLMDHERPAPFASPGTASPACGLRPPVTRTFIIPLLAASLSLGTVVVMTPADAAAFEARLSESSTRGELFAAEAAVPDLSDVVAALQHIRTASSLTWAEIATALGVSRRAVHHWAAGARVSAHHARRLRELAEVVAANDLEDSARTRARLQAPDPRGRSIIDQFARASQPDRAVPISTQSLADVLDDAEPLADSPAPAANRPSTLRARRLGRSTEPG